MTRNGALGTTPALYAIRDLARYFGLSEAIVRALAIGLAGFFAAAVSIIFWFNCSTRRALIPCRRRHHLLPLQPVRLAVPPDASTGTSCMIALWVQEGTREIGIWMTLGAAPGPILDGMVR